MVNETKRGLPWFIELYMRRNMVYGAVYDAYLCLWSCK